MNPMRPLVMSIVRLALVVAGLIAVTGSPARAADDNGNGGCSPATAGWYCATSDSFDGSSYCNPGQSGGCETCHYTGTEGETCFFSTGLKHHGYRAEQYPN
jgi:hypothetical protein